MEDDKVDGVCLDVQISEQYRVHPMGSCSEVRLPLPRSGRPHGESGLDRPILFNSDKQHPQHTPRGRKVRHGCEKHIESIERHLL